VIREKPLLFIHGVTDVYRWGKVSHCSDIMTIDTRCLVRLYIDTISCLILVKHHSMRFI